MFKKILISLIVCFSLTQSVYAEDVEIPTDGVKIDVERKALESDNATGAVDIKIYNNTNQEIGVLMSSQQGIGWLKKTIELVQSVAIIIQSHCT